ncbi:hypothetical protein B0H13DRAFT_1855617 [Mycena leptocephala]|nr:hypothetical protein B0H13DRAFT_1855617 [Mycena leptocephala]
MAQNEDLATVNPGDELNAYLKAPLQNVDNVVAWWGVCEILTHARGTIPDRLAPEMFQALQLFKSAYRNGHEPVNVKWSKPEVLVVLIGILNKKATHQSGNGWKPTVWPEITGHEFDAVRTISAMATPGLASTFATMCNSGIIYVEVDAVSVVQGLITKVAFLRPVPAPYQITIQEYIPTLTLGEAPLLPNFTWVRVKSRGRVQKHFSWLVPIPVAPAESLPLVQWSNQKSRYLVEFPGGDSGVDPRAPKGTV